MNQEQNTTSTLRRILTDNCIYRFIKSRTRSEWVEVLGMIKNKIYQEFISSAEKALIVGFLGGVIAVLFLKAVFFVCILLAMIAFLIWLIADEQMDAE